MNKYYVVIGMIDGATEELFGSFDRNDCVYELDANRDGWKEDGYKSIKITSKDVSEDADADIYDNIVSGKELFMQQAPNFNFELDQEGLIKEGLERGFITKVGNDKYLINTEY